MVLVTGAGGKTGRAVISALTQKGVAVRALVRRQSPGLTASSGEVSLFVGDMTDAAVIQRAVRGIRAVYHIAPNMHPAELAIGRGVIDAAPAGTHIVYHSVLHPQTEKMPHHWQKLRVEEHLLQSGLPFTILQPTAYMQNLLGNWQTITQQGILAMPYPTQTRISLVDLNDVAQVAGRVLTEQDTHVGATYELVGTKPLSQIEVANVLSVGLSRPVTATQIPLHQWQQQATAKQLPSYTIQTLSSMFRYYANNGLIGNPTILTHLLNHPPTTLLTFVTKNH